MGYNWLQGGCIVFLPVKHLRRVHHGGLATLATKLSKMAQILVIRGVAGHLQKHFLQGRHANAVAVAIDSSTADIQVGRC